MSAKRCQPDKEGSVRYALHALKYKVCSESASVYYFSTTTMTNCMFPFWDTGTTSEFLRSWSSHLFLGYTGRLGYDRWRHLPVTWELGYVAKGKLQSINQYIYNAPWYRGACYSADYAEAKRNVLSLILKVLTDGAVRQFREREFQSLGAATEKRRAAVSKLCGRTDRSFCVDDRSKRDWLYGLISNSC